MGPIERLRIVEWLRAHPDNELWPEQHDQHPKDYADAIERGDHWTTQRGES